MEIPTEDSLLEEKFAHTDLRTNWKKHSIPLDSIYDGGPGKNGIPAIDFPQFVSGEVAHQFLNDADFGIFLEQGGQRKFYPFLVLNWHEIVNDTIGRLPVAVTFCPLCASAIVYERVMGTDTLVFGVSGKLHESNLLMFDESTESLWSQASGKAIAGDFTGARLRLVNAIVISFEEVTSYYPNTLVLGTNTGYERDYRSYPYADYNTTDELYFPVSRISDRFRNKDMVYVVEMDGKFIAFPWQALTEAGRATVKTRSGTCEVTVEHYAPAAIRKETGEKLNGYFSYWFSWYATYGEEGTVWNSRR